MQVYCRSHAEKEKARSMGRVLHVLQPVNDSNARELACTRCANTCIQVYVLSIACIMACLH
jgi:hypothetical protein